MRVRKLVCSRFYSRLCFSVVTVFHPLLSGRYVNCIVCGGQRVCWPPNYDITASHASPDMSTYCTTASLLL